MSPDRERLKSLFAEACEMPESERAAFVARSADGDTEVRDELLSLLAAVNAPDNLIESNSLRVAGLFQDDADTAKDRKFGNYRIIREIGHGGMGAVFLAERSDGEFDMQVALKVVRQSVADSATIERFRRERQILAGLNHANIAKLYDGGITDRGEPFLAMEYIEGRSLIEYANEQRLSITERLELFLKVCSAVFFAHRSLIMHRDIKPGNILVTNDHEPKLLDFGLARSFDGVGSSTQTGLLAFTPAYASPEQIRGEPLTTATDVYSLGVVFYELISGEKPFKVDGLAYDQLVQTITNFSPAAPSQLPDAGDTGVPHRALKGDLDRIALKAIRKEPERRYASVAEFADDIRDHLAGRPIKARDNTFGYLASTFVRRNKVAVAAGALVVIALLTGLGVALWQADAARRQRDRAERRFMDVRQLSNSLLFEISPKIERLAGSTEAREILVSRALEYLDSLANESGDEADFNLELAAAYEKIGDLQGNPTNPNLIDLGAAIASYEKAKAMRLALADRSGLEGRQKLAENYRVLGNIYSQSNEIDASSQNTLAALQIYEDLVRADPDREDLRLGLAKVNYDYGLNLQANKKHSESLAYFARAKELLAGLAGQGPDRVEILRTAAEVKIQNANALSWAERQPEAEAEAKEAIAIYESLFAEDPNDVSVRSGMWLTYWLTSGIYQDQNDKLAYDFGQKALNVISEGVAKDSANIRAKQQLAKSYSKLGEVATTIGRSAEAITYLERACQMLSEITDSTTKNIRLRSELALSLRRLGNAQAEQGALDASLANLRRSEQAFLDILRLAPDDRRSNRNLADVYEQFGSTYDKLYTKERSPELRREAKEYYQKALYILSRLDANNALAEADRKFLSRMKAAVERSP